MPSSRSLHPKRAGSAPPNRGTVAPIAVVGVVAGLVAIAWVVGGGDANDLSHDTAQAEPGRIFLPIVNRDPSLPNAPRTMWDYAYTTAMNDAAWDAARGWVWAGGQDGLWAWDTARGDKHHFGRADGMAADTVTSLAVTPDGEVWVGHGSVFDAGVGASRRAVDGTWSVIAVRELLGNTNVLSVAVAPDGRVWLGTMDGAARREPDGTWTILGLPGTISRGFGWGSITAIAFDKDGNAWLGTGKGLLRVDTGGAWRQYEENDHRAVHDVAVDLDGNAWIARSVRDLIRVSPDAPMSGSAGRLTLTKADGLPSQFVSAIDFDQEGRLWVAWYDGIAVRNPDGTWTTWKGELGFTLPSRAVSGLDASGDEPVAAAWGMALRRDRDHASGTWTSFEPSSSLGASQAVSGIIVLPDGEVAAGIEAGGGPGGLAIRDNAGLWRLYPLSDATPGAIGSNDFGPRDIVPVMEPTNAAWDGSLWLVGNDNLYRWRSAIDGRPGRLERDVKPPDHDCLFPSHLAAPSLGSLWLACGSGDGQVSPSMWQRGTGIDAKWTAVALPEGREIFDLAVGPGAVVWAAAYDAAYRMTSDGWQRVTAILDGNDLFIWQIAFDRRGDAWLLEGVEGHVVVQPASGPPRTIHLLPNDWAQTLAPDPAGGMWVGTDAGVAFVDPAGVVTTANVPDPPSTPAGQSTNWNQVRSLAIGLRGELWVGTPMGVARWR